jgi:hypothetical protein
MNRLPRIIEDSVVAIIEELKTVLRSYDGKNLIVEVSNPNRDRTMIKPIDEIKAVANPISSFGKSLAATSQNMNPDADIVSDVNIINSEFWYNEPLKIILHRVKRGSKSCFFISYA